MDHQLFTFFGLGVLFTVSYSLRCYTGNDRQCLLAPDMTDCGDGAACRCVKYRYQCTADDQSCNSKEKAAGTIKWAYTIVSEDTCALMNVHGSGYMNVECCGKDRCNRPISGKCSWTQERRRTIRRLTDLLSLE